MTDIAPELIEEIRTKFQTAMMKDRELKKALEAINNGSISCSDALTYADKIGAALQEAVGEVLSTDVLPDGIMYYNIAERLVNEVYGDAFDLAEDASEQVMKSINDSAGIGLKVQASGSRKERLSEIIESIAGREYSGRTVTDFLSTTRSCPMNAAQDTFAANAEFQSSVGRSPKIVRTAHAGACEDCVNRVGEFKYPGVNKIVFWRHGSCRCTVEYYPGNGTVQNAHTKQWTKEQTNAKINTRKLTEADSEAAGRAARIKADESARKADRIAELFRLPSSEVVSIPPKSIDVDSLGFDIEHIAEKGHEATEDGAKQWIKDALFSMDVWNGEYTRYFSLEGASYVDNGTGLIKTAFSRNEYTQNVIDAIEELRK